MDRLIKKLVSWADPKLEKYRHHPPYTPATMPDLIALLRRTPPTVLTPAEKSTIAAAMSFPTRPIRTVMIPKTKMTLVHENDFLGPLTLDRLYKTGHLHFPVIGSGEKIIGLLHTEDLMRLKIKETDRASKYLDADIYYLREDYTCEQALAAYLRTASPIFIVINRAETPTGLLTYQLLTATLLGRPPQDTFTDDLDPQKVAARIKPPENPPKTDVL
jgi:CBS domain containing-hemolysin-like protein